MKFKKSLFTIFLFPIIILGLFCNSNSTSGLMNSEIELPPGFKIEVYAEDVDGARSMALTENGTLIVGSRGAGNVYAIKDNNGDYKADEIITIASGLNSPNGVALKEGDLYVAEISRILRFNDIENNLNDAAFEVINDNYPTDTHHGWKFIKFGPDGKLYVPVGAPCNICKSPEIYANITRINPDGTGREIYAHGIRNTVGFDWHPETGVLWFTDNGGDMLGDNFPPDELNRAPEPGMNFGYPHVHGNNVPDSEYGEGVDVSQFTPPAQELGPHVAALGMRFYTGDMFPAEYKNQIFIAEHGSWNRSEKIGYRVMLVKLDEDNNPVSYEKFAHGWLQGESVSGRPVDVLIMHDGSMLVSDDYADVIYRISYEK